MGEITVDFIAKDPWQMVLVEEGPWEDVPAHLAKLQHRLYSCLDAAIDGQLAEQFRQQAEAANQISLNIEQVSNVVQMNSATSEESAAASEELSSKANMLRELAVQFRLGDGKAAE